ncbi:hypothetical protein [Chryseolinea lacunae]|uniref:Uncharacterized protein n=1 Tax=Chryseolinea lacunae TaxID=2801331 RepID=A0ABS1L231_9BACT|nr:hypothetical protein [Chryseolinea lacunae]MBL0745740.1 hypothetical protein [Chryseolinea lacunae]
MNPTLRNITKSVYASGTVKAKINTKYTPPLPEPFKASCRAKVSALNKAMY